MKKIIFLILLIGLTTLVTAEVNHYYKIEVQNDQGKITYSSILVEPSTKQIDMFGADYVAIASSFDDKELNMTFFSFPNIIFYDIVDSEGNITGGGVKKLNQSKTTVYVPYFKNAKEIIVYDENISKKLVIPVNDLSTDLPKTFTKTQEKKLEQKQINASIKGIKSLSLWKGVLLAVGLVVVLLIIGFVLAKRKK